MACDPPACLGVAHVALTVPKGRFWGLHGAHRRRGPMPTDTHAAAGAGRRGRGSGSGLYSEAGGQSGRTRQGVASGVGC